MQVTELKEDCECFEFLLSSAFFVSTIAATCIRCSETIVQYTKRREIYVLIFRICNTAILSK